MRSKDGVHLSSLVHKAVSKAVENIFDLLVEEFLLHLQDSVAQSIGQLHRVEMLQIHN
jgi:hypothetical protein